MDFNIKKVLLLSDEKINEKNDWDSVEKKMNFKFPKDYKEFIDIYGAGDINDFICIYSPFCKNENLNLLTEFEYLKINIPKWEKEFINIGNEKIYTKYFSTYDEELDVELFNGKNGLIRWGCTTNGDELYWNILEDEIKLFIFNGRYGESKEYSMTMTEFLYKILDRTLDCPLFPNEEVNFLEEKNYYNRVD